MCTWSASQVERAVITMLDSYGRRIDYMRVSVTDKCNLRCRYCMPEGVEILPMSDLLTMEEITAVCRQAAGLGIEKIKITGGEPLVRRGVPDLVGMLKAIPGIRQVTMTTNGLLLSKYLPSLKEAGLDAVNISLDTLNRENYRQITGKDQLETVLSSIHKAVDAGLPVKINAVLLHGINDSEWPGLLALAREYPLDVRFIEMMPIGAGAAFESVSNVLLLTKIREKYPALVKDERIHGNGPAVYYRIPGFMGSVGLISALHDKFCSRCNRIRMTATGDLKACLCYGTSVNIRETLRSQGETAAGHLLSQVILSKPEAHCFEEKNRISETKKMISIGG